MAVDGKYKVVSRVQSLISRYTDCRAEHTSSAAVIAPDGSTAPANDANVVPSLRPDATPPHPSAIKHVKGTAEYVGDVALPADALHCALILSPVCLVSQPLCHFELLRNGHLRHRPLSIHALDEHGHAASALSTSCIAMQLPNCTTGSARHYHVVRPGLNARTRRSHQGKVSRSA